MLSELCNKFKLPRKDVKKLISDMYPAIKTSKMGGNTEKTPQLKYYGVHLATGIELLDEATILFITITDLEWNKMKNLLNADMSEEVAVNDSDVEEVRVGISNYSIIIVAKCSFKKAFVAYGATKTLLTMSSKVEYVIKVGTAAGHYNTGTVVVMTRDSNTDVVINDLYQESEIKEDHRIPMQRLVTFSHETKFEAFSIERNTITSGPRRMTEANQVADVYEWELSGVWQAIDRSSRNIQLGAVNVIIDHYGQSQRFKTIPVGVAMQNLLVFVKSFIDSFDA